MENFEESKQIEQEETLPPQPSPKKKYLLIGVIAAAFAVLIGGTVIFALIQKDVPSLPKVTEPEILPVDPTANWQTYRNDTYGFVVKYPKEWEAEQYELLVAGSYLFFNQDVEDFYRDFKYTGDSLVFSIAVRKESTDPTKFSLFKRLEQIEQGQDFVEIRPVTEERIVYTKVRDEFISNIPAVRYQTNEEEIDFSKGLVPRNNTVLLLKDDLAFIFAFRGGSQENVDKNKVVFDQILSTFRFIESNDTSIQTETPTSAMKQYSLDFSDWGLHYVHGYGDKKYLTLAQSGFYLFPIDLKTTYKNVDNVPVNSLGRVPIADLVDGQMVEGKGICQFNETIRVALPGNMSRAPPFQ